MPDWAAIIIIVAASFATGWLIVSLFVETVGRFDGDRLAQGFASVVSGILVVGWFALILAELGWFSLGLLAFFWFLLTALLAMLLVWKRRTNPKEEPVAFKPKRMPPIPLLRFLPTWFEYAFLIVWLVVASWLFFRPHQYVIGGADAGVYVNLAANISRTGSILIDDPILADLDPEMYPAFLRPLPEQERGTEVAPYYVSPGFYVTDAAEGKVMPQFYPLHPVWQAVAYGLGGVGPALLLTGVWALLGGLALYMTIRELCGWEIAALGLTGLSLTALQVWFARYPTTETLTQFLLWTAIWSTMIWLRGRQPRALWAALAGVAMGEVLLVRIDMYFLLILPVCAWIYLRWSKRWSRQDWWYFAPLAFLTVQSLLHARFQSTPYFYNTFSYGLNLARRNLLIPVLALLLGGAILILVTRYVKISGGFGRLRKPLLAGAILAIVLLFIYGWFIRPTLGDSDAARDYWFAGGQIPTQLDRENLVRLGWYLSPLGIILAATGICLMLWNVNARTAVILFIGLLFSLLYLWRIQANPHQIYTMRRYVPAVLPFFVLSTAYFLGWLLRNRREWMPISGIILSILWLVGLAWGARGFISQVDYEGIIAQMDELDSQLEPGSILIFEDENPITLGDLVGTPLHYIYGHTVYSLRDRAYLNNPALGDVMESWVRDGQNVYWIGESNSPELADLTFQNPFSFSFSVPQLETSYENKPTHILNIIWELRVSQLN